MQRVAVVVVDLDKLPLNRPTLDALRNEVIELRDLTMKLTAQLAIASSVALAKPKAKKVKKNA